MSDKPIQRGDLVMVVRPKPCGCGTLGLVFRVIRLSNEGRGRCLKCGRVTYEYGTPNACVEQGGEEKFPALSRLKRIDPPALSDETPTNEEQTA